MSDRQYAIAATFYGAPLRAVRGLRYITTGFIRHSWCVNVFRLLLRLEDAIAGSVTPFPNASVATDDNARLRCRRTYGRICLANPIVARNTVDRRIPRNARSFLLFL